MGACSAGRSTISSRPIPAPGRDIPGAAAEPGRAALARMRRMVPCQRCSVVLFDLRRGQAQTIAGFASGAYLDPATLPVGDLASAEALRQGSIRYLEDLSTVEDL